MSRIERFTMATLCGTCSALTGRVVAALVDWDPWLTTMVVGLCGFTVALAFGPRVWRAFCFPL